MKKSLVVLLSLLMIFTLVGCDSKQEESIKIEEPIKQEQVIKEEVKEEVKEETKTEQPEEVKEEKKVISDNIDITNMYFWVVTFDQYGNEVDRYTAKYGSTVYDPSNGKAVIVKGNTKFYVTYDYTPSSSSSDSGSSEPTPPEETEDPSEEVCEHLGEDIYYLALKVNDDGDDYFLLYKYTYDSNNYVYYPSDSPLITRNILEGLISDSFEQGDFFHVEEDSGVWTKCNFLGDGIAFYTLTFQAGENGSFQYPITQMPLPIGTPLSYKCYDDRITLIGLFAAALPMTIDPDENYELDYWTDGEGNVIEKNEEHEITSDLTIKVNFTQMPD